MNSNQTEKDRVTRRRTLKGIGASIGLAALGGAAGSPVAAQDDNGRRSGYPLETWPQYRYDPANTGLAPTEGPTENISVKWKYEMDHKSPYGPVIGDDTVYIGSWDETFYALYAETGKERWTYEDKVVKSEGALYDGKVYFTSVNGEHEPYSIHARDAEDGGKEWEVQADDLYDREEEDVMVFVRKPTVADGKVFVATDWNERSGEDGSTWGEEIDSVHALDAETGEELWHFTGMDHMAQKHPAYHKNGTVYVTSRDHNVYALDAETGEERWHFTMDSIGYTSPMVKDGIVYAVGYLGNTLYALDEGSGEELWSLDTNDRLSEPPLVKDGIVYYGTYNTTADMFGNSYDGDNSIYAYDPEADEHLWRTKTANVFGFTVARDTLYCNGYATCYGIDIETGDILWSFQAGEQIRGTPAVVDGTVYIASDDDFVYALEETE